MDPYCMASRIAVPGWSVEDFIFLENYASVGLPASDPFAV